MALLKSLKKVLTELGGTPAPRDLTAKTIDKIADNVSGGGGAAGLVVNLIETQSDYSITFTCDKTWKEIFDVFKTGGSVVMFYENAYNPEAVYKYYYGVVCVEDDFSGKIVVIMRDTSTQVLTTDSENGYPSFIET